MAYYNYNTPEENTSKLTPKEKLIELWEKAKDILHTTSLEIAILAVLWAGIGIYHQTRAELRRSEKIPLAFSEIGAIERDAKKHNIKIWVITEYELKINDMCMKIFEAYNEAQYPFIPSQKTEIFAWNLYNTMDMKHIYKYNLKDLLTQVPSYIPEVNNKLRKYQVVSDWLDIANSNLDKAWDEDHDDHYHTERRTRTVSDWNGKSHTETYTEQVYDNTTHSYDYDRQEGNAAAQNLNNIFKNVPNIALEEQVLKTKETNADGEYAAEKSRQLTWPSKRLSQQELLDIANTWYKGSTLLTNLNKLEREYPQLHQKTFEWNQQKKTAHDESYTTTSRSDSGPEEFQTVENTLSLWVEINDNLKEMLSVIEQTNTDVPLLKQKIEQFIDVWYTHAGTQSWESKKLADEVLTLTKKIYKMNFKEGINVDRFRWGMIFLFALIGWALGAWAGAWLDYLDNKINLYDRIKFKKKDNY